MNQKFIFWKIGEIKIFMITVWSNLSQTKGLELKI